MAIYGISDLDVQQQNGELGELANSDIPALLALIALELNAIRNKLPSQ